MALVMDTHEFHVGQEVAQTGLAAEATYAEVIHIDHVKGSVVLLLLEMHEPLRDEHGAPVRLDPFEHISVKCSLMYKSLPYGVMSSGRSQPVMGLADAWKLFLRERRMILYGHRQGDVTSTVSAVTHTPDGRRVVSIGDT